MRHLWEIDHPYYMSDGMWNAGDCHFEWDSWADFIAEYGDADIDYNRVHRWDWRHGDGWELPEGVTDVLCVYIIHQRKAMLVSHEIIVTRDQEPQIIAYLEPHWEQEREIWEPFATKSPSP